MTEYELYGSGGSVVADITEEQAKASDLGVGKRFLAPIGKLEQSCISKYSCNACKADFDKPPIVKPEEDGSGPEQVSENLMLIERGQYVCSECNGTIGEYRVFKKTDDSKDVGAATPSSPPQG